MRTRMLSRIKSMPISLDLIHANLLVQGAVTDCRTSGTAGAGTRILRLVRVPNAQPIKRIGSHGQRLGDPVTCWPWAVRTGVGFRYRLIPQSESKSPRQARAPVGTQARSAWLPFSTRLIATVNVWATRHLLAMGIFTGGMIIQHGCHVIS